MPEFRRKRNRLEKPAYVAFRWYYVTICTADRRPCFRDPELIRHLLYELDMACTKAGFSVYAYCFLPDHLHLELAATDDNSNLPGLLREFKGRSTARARALGIRGLWQKGYYDHVMRPGENENRVAWYIFNNPVRKSLVKDPRDWPHSGSMMFDWKKAVAPAEELIPPWKRNVAG